MRGATESPRYRRGGFDKNGMSQNSPRMGKFAGSILAANQLGKKSKGEKANQKDKRDRERERPWYLAATPDELQVPTEKQQAERWLRKVLDLNKEREILEKMRPFTDRAAAWPDDTLDARSPGGRAVMGSHKLLKAKEHALMEQQLALVKYNEWKANNFKPETDKTITAAQQAYMALGLTEFETSLEEYEKANRSLLVMRKNATFRPPELHQVDAILPTFDRLRDRYYWNRGRETVRLMSRIGFDFTEASYAQGGPSENRTSKSEKRETVSPADEPKMNLVLSPSSPMGYQMRPMKQAPKFFGEDEQGTDAPITSFEELEETSSYESETNLEKSEGFSPPNDDGEEDHEFQMTLPTPGFGNRHQGNIIRFAGILRVSTDGSERDRTSEADDEVAPLTMVHVKERKKVIFQEEKRYLSSPVSSHHERMEQLRSSEPSTPESNRAIASKEAHAMSNFMKATCKCAPDTSPARRNAKGLRFKQLSSQ